MLIQRPMQKKPNTTRLVSIVCHKHHQSTTHHALGKKKERNAAFSQIVGRPIARVAHLLAPRSVRCAFRERRLRRVHQRRGKRGKRGTRGNGLGSPRGIDGGGEVGFAGLGGLGGGGREGERELCKVIEVGEGKVVLKQGVKDGSSRRKKVGGGERRENG